MRRLAYRRLHSLRRSFGGRLQEQIAFNETEQVEDGPGILTALISARQKSITAHDGLGPAVAELVLHEAAKTQHFVDDEAGRDFAMIDGYDARRASQRRAAGDARADLRYRASSVCCRAPASSRPAASAPRAPGRVPRRTAPRRCESRHQPTRPAQRRQPARHAPGDCGARSRPAARTAALRVRQGRQARSFRRPSPH